MTAEMKYPEFKVVYLDKKATYKQWQKNKAYGNSNLRGEKSADKILEQVNPNYSSGKYEWTHNCQRCIVAWEMLWRGYDVTAKPFNANDSIGSSGIAAWKHSGRSWLDDDDFWSVTIKAWFKRDITKAFNEWGEGARAAVFVEYKNGSKHAFTARMSDVKIVYEDPQANTILDIDKMLGECTDEHYRLWFMRTDNRGFTEAANDAVEYLE